MKFLLNMEEKRAKEREEDKQLREKERIEARAELEQCVENKISAAIKPLEEKTASVVKAQEQLQDKTASVVKAQEQLQDKVSVLAEELKTVQSRMNSSSMKVAEGASKSVEVMQNIQAGRASMHGEALQQVAVVGGQAVGLAEIISEARRTVGLYRIDEADLHRMKQEQYGGAKTPEEEKL